MNAPTAATTGTAWAQARRTAEPGLRLTGATSAAPFQDLLAAFAPVEQPIGIDQGAPEDTSNDDTDEAGLPAEAEAEQSDQAGKAGAPTDGSPAEGVDRPDGSTTAHTAPTGPTGSSPEPALATAASPPRTPGEAADRQLTHAASIDLAALARDQLRTDAPPSEAARPPEEIPAPKQPVKQEMVSEHGGGAPAPPTGPPKWTTSGKQPPTTDATRTPPAVTSGADRSSSPPATTQPPPGLIPADANASQQAASAPQAVQAVAGSQAAANTKPEVAPVAINRTALLERLTASAEAGRGAVAATERVGQQPVGREADRAQPNGTTSAEAARSTREAVLNTVQRGLASVLSQGGGRMTVILRPERLGEVQVRMETADGGVNARLSATTDAARQTLEAGLDTLRAALEARGVRVDSLQIDPAPADADATRQSPTGQPGADPDGQREHPDRRHDRSRRADTQAESATTVAASGRTPVGIWTELGLDAIA